MKEDEERKEEGKVVGERKGDGFIREVRGSLSL